MKENSFKKGFTLIELLAVIVVLAVIAVIAVPLILNVINDAKKSALRDTAYALTKAAENYVALEQSRGNKVEWNVNKITNEEYISFNLSKEEDVKKLNVKGSVPKTGRVEITKKGDTFVVAINDNVCAKKNYGETLVNLLSLKSDDICLLTASTDDLSSDDANDIISTVTNLSSKVEELEEKNTNLEKKVSTIQGETIDKIYPVGSIYISTDLDTVDKVVEKFGGEWEVYGDGRVLRSTTEKSGVTNETDGTVSLTSSNLPEHSHSYTPVGKVSSTFTGSAATSGSTGSGYSIGYGASTRTTSTNGSHIHVPNAGNRFAITTAGADSLGRRKVKTDSSSSYYAVTSSNIDEVFWIASTAYAGDHAHTYPDYYASSISGVAAHTHSVTAKGSVSSTFTGTASTTGKTGSNTAFSVLDPYITVYMYKRVK